MPYVDRWTSWPSKDILMAIEGVKIIDLLPPGSIAGAGTGVVAVIGEPLKQGVRTQLTASNQQATDVTLKPTLIGSAKEFLDTFGGWGEYSNPGGLFESTAPYKFIPGLFPDKFDGNLFLALRNKQFAKLIVVAVPLSVGTCTLQITAGSGTTVNDVIVPPGIRVADENEENVFATCEEVVVKKDAFVNGVATIPNVKIRRLVGSDTGSVSLSKVLSPEKDLLKGYTISCTGGSIDADLTRSSLEGLYTQALDTLESDEYPANIVNLVVSCRHTQLVALAIKSHVENVSAHGHGRIGIVSPPLGTSKADAIQTGDFSVESLGRSDRICYAYPGIKTFIPEIPSSWWGKQKGSDGIISWPSDIVLASVISQTPPHHNPAESNPYMSYVLGLEDGITMTRSDYENARARGVCAPRIDPATGPQFQSGVTSVDPAVYPNLRQIYRRRMADFIQDSIADRLGAFVKTLNTASRRNAIRGEIDAFLSELKSVNNPEAQMIEDYIVDDKSGNTPDLLAQGIVVFIVKVRLLSSMDFIVLQTTIGESVKVQEV
jgi:hypothetical protein